MSQQENNRKNFFKDLHTNAKDLEIPGTGTFDDDNFVDEYPNTTEGFKKFKSFCFGSDNNAQWCYNWLKSEKYDSGKPIIKDDTTIEIFYQKFICDVPFGRDNEYCISGDWNQGNRLTTSNEWLEHFPCLKKYFNEDSLKPMVDNQGYSYFENKNPKNGKIYHFYSDGKIYTDTDQDTGKSWKCSTQRGQGAVIVEIYKTSSVISEQIPFDPGTGGGNSGGGNTGGGGSSSGWNEHCDGTDANPYKVGCKSANIGKAQSCLGSLYKGTVDDKFGKMTQAAIKEKLGKNTFTIEDLNRRICDIKFDDSDDSSIQNTSELP